MPHIALTVGDIEEEGIPIELIETALSDEALILAEKEQLNKKI